METSNQPLWECLGRLRDPFSGQNLVASGCVRDIRLADGTATVSLTPPHDDPHRNEALQDAIQRELIRAPGVERVVVFRATGADGLRNGADRAASSKPLPVAGGPETPAILPLPQLAPEIGYNLDGPSALLGPEDDPALAERYDGWPPVFQWQVDPSDSTLPSGEPHVEFGGWEYDIWWQAHPAGLIYAAIQAMSDDPAPAAMERQHPIGRNVVVNLVFDQKREGVIAVYGTARDFRPFVEAFRIGLGLQQSADGSKS